MVFKSFDFLKKIQFSSVLFINNSDCEMLEFDACCMRDCELYKLIDIDFLFFGTYLLKTRLCRWFVWNCITAMRWGN